MSTLRVNEIDLNDPGNASITIANSWNVSIVSGGAERLKIDTSGRVQIHGTLTVGTANITATIGVNVQTFNASGTWTKPPDYAAGSRVHVQAWGAGGSGSRNSTAGSNAGGGGGGYNDRWLNLSQLGSTETVIVGLGGAARSTTNQDGASGGNTSLGSLVFAYGGAGGTQGATPAGGGGGGQLGPAVGYVAGSPISTWQGYGDNSVDSSSDAYIHGGGGGRTSAAGGGTGGTSSYAGNGGAAGATGTAGSEPGGGGGSGTSTSGAGANGRIIVTVFPG